MRGVAGILFIFLGLVMGYMILSGQFPSATGSYLGQFPQAQVTQVPAGKASSSALNAVISSQGNVEQPARGDGGNSLGLPTTKHLQDVNASQGGMK